jgi:hypothetical protein
MSDISSQPIETGASPAGIEHRGPKRWQLGLRTLVLLMAVIAVWMTVVANRRRNTVLETRIRTMRPLAHELKIDDLSQIAVVKLDELWMDDERWDLFLPTGEYRVCVATREVGKQGLVASRKSAPIKAGKHRLALEFRREFDRWPIRVTSDGSELLAFEETKDWGASGSSSGAGDYSQSTQLPADQPLVLYRRRYMVKLVGQASSVEPTGPAEGLLMWIEPVGGRKLTP